MEDRVQCFFSASATLLPLLLARLNNTQHGWPPPSRPGWWGVVSGGFWRVKIRAAPAFGCCREAARVGVPWLAGCPPRMVLAAPLFYSRDTYRYRFWRHRYFIRRRSTARGVWHRAGSRGRGAAMSRGFTSHTQGGGPNQASSGQRFARGGLCPAYPSRLKLAHASVAALAITVAMLCISVSRRERGFNANTHGRTDRTGRWCLLASRL
jgi:hypothetical protein